MGSWSKAGLFAGVVWSLACGDSGGSSGGDAGPKGDGGGGNTGDSGEAPTGGGSTGAGCEALCTGAGFASGDEMNFGGEVIECVCGGSGAGIAQTACASYCSSFDVAADRSYLSMQSIANDKCVCDGTQPSGGTGGQTTGGANATDITVDADGFPSLPTTMQADATGAISVSVTNSSSVHLTNGVYTAPNSPTATGPRSAVFVPGGLAITNMPSLQVSMNLSWMQAQSSFECDGIADIIVRYGMPPSGNQQLLALSCQVDYDYDAASKTYTGTFTASMGDGVSEPSDSMKADLRARFTFTVE